MSHLLRRFSFVMVSVVAGLVGAPAALSQNAAPPVVPAPKAPGAGAVEQWKGVITLGPQTLEFSAALTRGAKDGEGASGTLSIPMQGLTNAALRDVVFEGAKARFTLGLEAMPQAQWPTWDVEFAADGQSARGVLKQAGMEFPLTMTRMKEGERIGPSRPQEPKAPFPYASREVKYTNPADGAALAGTLTIPEGKGPHPCVLMITGSGAQDRDESLLGHKPFLVIADYLSRHGIGVLRVDDRGIGASSSPKKGEETTDDFVGDVMAGVAFLKTQPEVDPKRIGLVGHSEGGLIAPMVAAKNPDVAFVVMLAGTGVSGREVMMAQIPAGMLAAGVAPAVVDGVRVELVKALDAVNAGDEGAVKAAMGRLVRAQMGLTPDAPNETADRGAEGATKMFTSAWFKRFLTLDPGDALRKTKQPVLVMNGSLDMQVVATQNIPAIRKALDEGGNKDVTIVELPGLNHLFQTAKTGGEQEYATIDETFAPAALETMTKWIRAHAGLDH